MNRSTSDHLWKPGSSGQSFRPSIGILGGVHTRPHTWDSDPGPSVSRVNAQPLDH